MLDGRISDLAAGAAKRFGDMPAFQLLGEDAVLGFAEIDRRAARFAGGLAAAGVGRGDRVVLHLPNGWRWIVAYHAIARLGAVVVPANILLTPAEVGFLATDSVAAAVILPADRQAPIASALAGSTPRIVATGGADCDFARMLEGAPLAPVAVSPDDLFTIGYTSGTTGRPKGAMLTHRNVFASTALTATIHVRARGETVLTALPFPHVYGNVVMNAAFLAGMRILAMPRFDAGLALAAISAERPTVFEGVPTMFYQMLAHPDLAAADFSSLSRCTVGGQTMPTAKLDEVVARFGCPICELWGMTEVAGPAISHSPYWPARHGSIGLAFPGVETRVADLSDRGRDAAADEAGELCVRGPLVTRGYWRNDAATAEAIDGDGWLATGDIAVRDADGYLRIVDRRKDLIITGGYNIYPAELEQVIAAHPSVAMVAVAAVADAEKGELAKAFVVLRPDHAADAAALDRHCRAHLAPYKVPRLFAFVDDLPKTSTGKILRRALQPERMSQ
ncbi:AMP-binding protein [Sphingomonas colocasiae]|uniref:AMP-binding protein n=1 Tax=Sphingomonas colocasiae TaxID=1848973 RepID=A0ABS7PLN9_9SPHN|nr:AMP-binding protein [Sphingomonas colocasiae]MBY8822163.1 AMP-binding protein [Sphingomonas colocasiae]